MQNRPLFFCLKFKLDYTCLVSTTSAWRFFRFFSPGIFKLEREKYCLPDGDTSFRSSTENWTRSFLICTVRTIQCHKQNGKEIVCSCMKHELHFQSGTFAWDYVSNFSVSVSVSLSHTHTHTNTQTGLTSKFTTTPQMAMITSNTTTIKNSGEKEKTNPESIP